MDTRAGKLGAHVNMPQKISVLHERVILLPSIGIPCSCATLSASTGTLSFCHSHSWLLSHLPLFHALTELSVSFHGYDEANVAVLTGW